MNDRFVKIIIEKAEYHKNHGHVEQALAILNDAASLFPDNPELCYQRTAILIEATRYDDVIKNLETFSLDIPEHSTTLFRIGRLLARKGLHLIAIGAFLKAIVADGSNAWAYNNLGLSKIALGKRQEAYDAISKAIEIKPNTAAFHNNLATLLMLEFQLGDAVRHYQRALELNPVYVAAYSNMGLAYCFCGDVRALETICKALELEPTSRPAVDALLSSLNYIEQSPMTIFVKHKQWAVTAYYAPPSLPSRLPIANRHSKIRVGYVSADFRNHPVAIFFEPVLRYYDRNLLDVYCYAHVSNPDATTAKLKELGGIWRSTVGLSDQEVAGQIRQDGIDILVDLGGFTEGNRLGAFILKPAPIQCSWLGYPNTTGLPQIDYRITDAVADPPGMTEHLYTEKLIHLPRTFLCYTPETDRPPLPCPDGPITFCCFNNLPKISAPVYSMWAAILTALPEARLLLKSAFLGDPSVCSLVRSRFKARAIDPERIDLRGFTSAKQEHLDLYGTCHIALDTYPYHGTTTTCEALWMGVPVISLAGFSHVSRVGASILTAVGVPELIVTNCDQYIACAVELARNPIRIARYRQTLRSLMQSSTLMNAKGFASDLELAFRGMLQGQYGKG